MTGEQWAWALQHFCYTWLCGKWVARAWEEVKMLPEIWKVSEMFSEFLEFQKTSELQWKVLEMLKTLDLKEGNLQCFCHTSEKTLLMPGCFRKICWCQVKPKLSLLLNRLWIALEQAAYDVLGAISDQIILFPLHVGEVHLWSSLSCA